MRFRPTTPSGNHQKNRGSITTTRVALQRAKFLAENPPQHFGRNRPVVLRQRRTQNLIHQRLIPTARSLGLCAIPFYDVSGAYELLRLSLKCRSTSRDEPTYIGPAERLALMRFVTTPPLIATYTTSTVFLGSTPVCHS